MTDTQIKTLKRMLREIVQFESGEQPDYRMAKMRVEETWSFLNENNIIHNTEYTILRFLDDLDVRENSSKYRNFQLKAINRFI